MHAKPEVVRDALEIVRGHFAGPGMLRGDLLALLRHMSARVGEVAGVPVPGSTMVEIVDKIFLPLVSGW
jgi:hypothetical protein